MGTKPRAPPNNVAVCLVGGARDADVTGHTLMKNLVAVYSPCDIFINTPLDENTAKIGWMFGNAPETVVFRAVRFFPVIPVNESLHPMEALCDMGSPNGKQGMLQYFTIVEGCFEMMVAYEQKHGFEYKWVVRTRIDTYWIAPPPPLHTLDPLALTVPNGSDWTGLNDRFGIGNHSTTEASMRRLSRIGSIFERVKYFMTSEPLMKEQMYGFPISRSNVAFCVLTRRLFTEVTQGGCSGCVYDMASTAPLSGAYCQPCVPCLTGPNATAELQPRNSGNDYHIGGNLEGINICQSGDKQVWAPDWEKRFDSFAEKEASNAYWKTRSQLYHLPECSATLKLMELRTENWTAPLSALICLRALMGSRFKVGPGNLQFNVFSSRLTAYSVMIFVQSPSDSSFNTELESEFKKMMPRTISMMAPPSIHAFIKNASLISIDAMKIVVSGGDMGVIDDWLSEGSLPVCQLFIELQDGPFDLVAKREEISRKLWDESALVLDSCVRNSEDSSQRCTFFSADYCTFAPR